MNLEIFKKAKSISFLKCHGYYFRNGGDSRNYNTLMERYWVLHHEIMRIIKENSYPLLYAKNEIANHIFHFHRWIQEMFIQGLKETQVLSRIETELKRLDWKELLSLISDDDREQTQLIRNGDSQAIIAYNKRMLPPAWRLWFFRLLN